MSKKSLHEQTNSATATQEAPIENNSSPEQKRRMLLKGTVAVPVILTLHSGAALARTSNITGEPEFVTDAVFRPNPTTGKLELVCAIPQEELSTGIYDLGNSPQYVLIDDPKINPNLPPEQLLIKKTEQLQNCHNQIPKGIMISATAFTSIAAKTGAFDDMIL